jgi:hypothetical protein
MHPRRFFARIDTAIHPVALSLMALSATLGGCVVPRYIDRSTPIQVSGDDAQRIDELDQKAPNPRSSKEAVPPHPTKIKITDCQYWRSVRTADASESKGVKRYVEARTDKVCSAFPDVFEDTPPQGLEKIIAKRTLGTRAVGQVEEGNLDPFDVHRYNLERGQCYVVVLRLLPGFEPHEDAKKYVRFAAVSEGVQIYPADAAETEVASDHLHGRGSAIEIGCPTRAGAIRIQADPAQIAKGRYSIELRAKPISEADLNGQEAAADQLTAEAVTEAARHLKQVCSDCLDMHDYCVAHPSKGTFDCKAAFSECLETNAHATPADCKSP